MTDLENKTPYSVAKDFTRYVGSDDPSYLISIQNSLEAEIKDLITKSHAKIPVSEIKTPEQIMKEHELDFDWMSSSYTKNMIIMAMETYANQFK